MCVSKYLEYLGPSQTTGLTQNDIDAFVDQVKAGNVDLTTLTIGSTTPGASGIVPYITSAQQDAFSAAGFDQKTAALVNTFWQPVAGSAAAAYKVISPDNLPPFDITITFGNYPKDRPEAQDEFQSSHTVKVLSNVEITGYSMQIAITGEPIQEVYAFIARAMDQPLTRTAKVLTMVSDVKAGINNPS